MFLAMTVVAPSAICVSILNLKANVHNLIEYLKYKQYDMQTFSVESIIKSRFKLLSNVFHEAHTSPNSCP